MSRTKPHPFLPRGNAQSPKFLKWLRRTHAWFGIFGAAAGLLFAATAIFLSHHNFGIETAAATNNITLSIPANVAIDSEDTLGAFVKQELDLRTAFRPARSTGKQDGKITISFSSPGEAYTVSYRPGADAAQIRQQSYNFLATINRMHRGTGVSLGWLILGDVFAFSLIFLAISGFLLWTRMHGNRLVALGLLSATTAASIYYMNVSA